MARKKTGKRAPRDGVNRSQAIRDVYLAAGGKIRPCDIISTLRERGITVSPALVSNVIKRELRRKKPAAVASASAGNGRVSELISFDMLLEAKRLVAKAGSVKQARNVLDALVQLA